MDTERAHRLIALRTAPSDFALAQRNGFVAVAGADKKALAVTIAHFSVVFGATTLFAVNTTGSVLTDASGASTLIVQAKPIAGAGVLILLPRARLQLTTGALPTVRALASRVLEQSMPTARHRICAIGSSVTVVAKTLVVHANTVVALSWRGPTQPIRIGLVHHLRETDALG